MVVQKVYPDGSAQNVEVLTNMSKASDGKTENGARVYYVDYINTNSKYVHIMNHPIAGGDWVDWYPQELLPNCRNLEIVMEQNYLLEDQWVMDKKVSHLLLHNSKQDLIILQMQKM
jgi:hypothetical protein